MPRHLNYVEPYAGGLSVLLNRDPADESLWLPGHDGVSEVANDLDRDLMNFWKVLQTPQWFLPFHRLCEATPFSEIEWQDASLEFLEWPSHDSNVSDAVVRSWKFFINCRMSLAGRRKGFTGITKTRVRRGMNNEVSAWLSAVDGLPDVHARLKRVMILNRDALEVLRQFDVPSTFAYCDAPYLHSTRVTTSDYGRYEMSVESHRQLLDVLSNFKGKFALSGYPSELYEDYAKQNGWRVAKFTVPNNAAGGEKKRAMTECLWMNYDPPM